MSEKLKARFGHGTPCRPPDETSVCSSAIRKEVSDFMSRATFSDSNLDKLEQRLLRVALQKKVQGSEDTSSCVSDYSLAHSSSRGGKSRRKPCGIGLGDVGNATQLTTSSTWSGLAKPSIALNLSFQRGTSALPS